MEKYLGAKVVVVDDEPDICDALAATLQIWELNPVVFNHPREAATEIKNNGCDLVLLDLFFPDTTGFDLIPDIVAFCPECKVIIMTGYADKDNAIRALQLGAFDFLEKPFQTEILKNALERALEAKYKESKLNRLVAELQKSEADLMDQKQQLQHLNEHLLETNKAMSVLAQNISREREETEKQMARKLRTLVVPVLNQLGASHQSSHHIQELELVVTQLIEELTSGMSMDSKVASVLSFTELRVASFIKNGLTTEEIADQLHVAPSTVKTHRRNIRKKLKISNSKVNLKGFLASLPGDFEQQTP